MAPKIERKVQNDIFGRNKLGLFPFRLILTDAGTLKPYIAIGPGCSNVLVAHALPKTTDSTQDIGMRVSGYKGTSRPCQSHGRWQGGSRYRHPHQIFVYRSPCNWRQYCWLAAYFWSEPPGLQSKVKIVFGWMATVKAVIEDVLHHIGSPEIPCRPYIDININYITSLTSFCDEWSGNYLFK